MERTNLSTLIENITMELIVKFVESDGRLTIREQDELNNLKCLCEEMLTVDDAMDLFDKMKEMKKLHISKEEA